MKKLICLVLFLVLLVSCSSDVSEPDAERGTDALPDHALEEESEAPQRHPDIPENDFGGREIIIAVPSETLWGYDVVVPEGETGEPVYDGTFRRNRIIEDRYNISLKQIDIPFGDFEARVKNSIQAQDNMFDIVFPRLYQAAPLAADGFLYDLKSVPHINPSNIWWDEAIIRDLSLAGRVFFLAGDIHMYAYDGTFVLYFNKVMHKDLGLENLYELVLGNNWTIDKFDEIMRTASADLDGDGVMSFNDRFGVFSWDHMTTALLTGANSNIFEKVSETEIIFNMGSEKFNSVIEKILHVMNFGDAAFNGYNTAKWTVPSSEWGYAARLFTEDRALFMCEVVDITRRYRDMESDFGILPFPKYDTAQQEFYSYVSEGVLVVGVPTSMQGSDAEMIGSVIEDMAYEGRINILPAYYDITLLRKNTRDEESAAMLDIVFRQRKYPIDVTYNFNGMTGIIYSMVNRNVNEVASLYERHEPRVQQLIDRLLENYADMG